LGRRTFVLSEQILLNLPAELPATILIVLHVGADSRLAAILRAQIGHDFTNYRQRTIARRIQRRMNVLRIDQVSGLVDTAEIHLGGRGRMQKAAEFERKGLRFLADFE
jgi:hypothetical protein